jgi:hypothetical protein
MILREYLIALGFKVDEQSFRRFNTYVGVTKRDVTELGAAAVTAATAIGVVIERVAREYEELYYISRRTGSSVANIKSYGFAWGQIGLSADAAKQSIENFAQTIRTNPGLNALLRNMGIDTTDAVAAQQQFVGRLKQFGEKGYFIGAQIAAMYGMGEKEFYQLYHFMDQSKAWQEDYSRRLREAGINAQQYAGDFRNYSNQVNQLGSTFGITAERIAHDWLPAAEGVTKTLQEGVEWFNKYNASTGGAAGQIASITLALGGAATALQIVGRLLGIQLASGTIGAFFSKGGALAGLIALLEYMKGDDAQHSRRSTVRSLFGIEETEADKLAPPNFDDPWAERINPLTRQRYLQGSDPIGIYRNSMGPNYRSLDRSQWMGTRDTGYYDASGSPAYDALQRGGSVTNVPSPWGSPQPRPAGGSGGAGIPDIPMSDQERNTLGLILKYESKDRNVMNYAGRAQGINPEAPKGYTAQGYYQVLNSNWARLAPGLGIAEHNAMAASKEDQTRVALALLRESGVGNWANYNPALRSALARGEIAGADQGQPRPDGGVARQQVAGYGGPDQRQVRPDGGVNINGAFNQAIAPAPSAPTNVTINQKTDIHVTGSDAKEIGKNVLDGQDKINSNVVRNVVEVVR